MDGYPPARQHSALYYTSQPVSSSSSFSPPHTSQYASSSSPSSVQGESSQINPHSDYSAGVPNVHRREMKTLVDVFRDTGPGPEKMPFEVDNTRPDVVQVNFDSESNAGLREVYVRKRSHYAIKGKLNFEPVGETEQGNVTLAGGFDKATLSSGRAQMFLADSQKFITVVQLNDESVTITGGCILAFEPSLAYKTKNMNELCKNISPGLFIVQLRGHGCVAILSRGKPLTLLLQDGEPVVRTYPEAIVAWSGDLNPDFETDVQSKGISDSRAVSKLKRYFLHRNGKSVRMMFDPKKGHRFVVVQPYEE